jgi:membrane protein
MHVLVCAFRRWFADNGSATAAALAFYCAFSLAPLLVIVLTVSGWVVGAQSAFHFVEQQLVMLFGSDTAQILVEAVRSSQDYEGYLATAVSIATLLVAATTVLAELEQALNRIWGTNVAASGGVRTWIRRRVLSLGFILALSFMLLATLTISTMVVGVRAWLAERYAPLLGLVGMLDMLVSLAVITLLFALIYRYMPGQRLRWGVVVAGGLVTALLFALGKWVVGLYLAHSAVPNAFGAAASFAALLLWLYYTAQIFLFGAEFTACLGGLGRENAPARRPQRASGDQPGRPDSAS